jgi:hypothetical protein
MPDLKNELDGEQRLAIDAYLDTVAVSVAAVLNGIRERVRTAAWLRQNGCEVAE